MFAGELRRIRDYAAKPHEFATWRERQHEVDILISDGHGPVLAFECKAGGVDLSQGTLAAFRARFPKVRLVVVSRQDTVPRRLGEVHVLPVKDALDLYAGT